MSEENLYTFENPEYRKTYWHTCSHVMAQAVKRLYPQVKLAIGPSIENGFYYDFDSDFSFNQEHLDAIEALYTDARAYMRSHGNAHQWTGGYPSRALVAEDIRRGECFLCVEEDALLGVFCYFRRPDPTYAVIHGGAWLNSEPYGVIHRIAVSAHRRGVASFCFAYALSQCANLRIDTHRDNIPMQRSLEKNGFSRCGTIYLENGDPRIAYHKVKGEKL